MDKPLTIAASIVAIATGVVGVVAYFKYGSSPPPQQPAPTSIRADRGGLAAGNDVRVQGDHIVSQHDFDADARQEAMRYVRVSGEACGELKRKVEALDPNASFNPQDMGDIMPMQLYPHQIVADHFGDDVVATINGKLEAITAGNVALMRPLIANMISSTMPSSKRREAKQEALRAEFPAAKQKQVQSIGELCGYLDGLAQRG